MGATVLTIVDTDETTDTSPLGAPPRPHGASWASPERLHLRSVPTGVAVARSRRPALAPVRLTRFARLTITVSTLALLIALGVGLSGQLAAATTTTSKGAVTVEQGQTLSQIALRERPDLRVDEAVVALQIANGLSTDQVHAGQRLTVPAP